MAEDHQDKPKDGRAPPPSPLSGNGAPGDRPELDRLPPPAFPPGQRGVKPRRNLRTPVSEPGPEGGGVARGGDSGVPDEAFISPDDPIERKGSRIAPDAFISPDEPIPERGPEEGVVTGIGDDQHLGDEEQAYTRSDPPAVADLVLQVRRLADALRDRGESGLRTTPDMSRFEATLRAYCVGYLSAQREAGDG